MKVHVILAPYCMILFVMVLGRTPVISQTIDYNSTDCIHRITIPTPSPPFIPDWLRYDCSTWTKRRGDTPPWCRPGFRFIWEYGDGNYSIYDKTWICKSATEVIPDIGDDIFINRDRYEYHSSFPTPEPHVSATRIYTKNEDPFNKVIRTQSTLSSPCTYDDPPFEVSPLAGRENGERSESLTNNNINLQFPFNAFVVGSEATLIINYANLNEDENPDQSELNGTLRLNYDGSVMYIEDIRTYPLDLSHESVNMPLGYDYVEITFSNLSFEEHRNIFLTFKMEDPHTDTFLSCPVPFEFELLMNASNSTGPLTLDPEVLKGVTDKSTDPNYKLVYPRYQTCDDDIDTLTYIIHFENVGTGPVDTILVRDTIHPQLLLHTLDIQRITMGNREFSSYLFYYEELPDDEGWIVEWTFIDNPVLRGINEENNGLNPDYNLTYGEIEYTINPSCSMEFGDTLDEQAIIYFGSNCGIPTQSSDSSFYAKKCLAYKLSGTDTTITINSLTPYLTTPVRLAADQILVLEQPAAGTVTIPATNDQIFYTAANALPLPESDHAKIQIFKDGRSDILCLTFCDTALVMMDSCSCDRDLDTLCITREAGLPTKLDVSDINHIFSDEDCLAPTSISPPTQTDLQLIVYPNPASELISIDHSELPRQNWEQIELLSIHGQVIKSVAPQSQGITQMLVDGLPRGVYLLKMGKATQRILIE